MCRMIWVVGSPRGAILGMGGREARSGSDIGMR